MLALMCFLFEFNRTLGSNAAHDQSETGDAKIDTLLYSPIRIHMDHFLCIILFLKQRYLTKLQNKLITFHYTIFFNVNVLLKLYK